MDPPQLVDHFFRHEYGRLVAILSSRVGVCHIEDIEDAVQSALMTALDTWTTSGLPDNPSAWLFRVANNELVGGLRQRGNRQRLLEENLENNPPESGPEGFDPKTVPDELLRMLFACCDDALPAESQLVLALKTLCGFDVREIALRLFTTEANIYKRLNRAKKRLRELEFRPVELSDEELARRQPAVRRILYLIFTEGHLSSHADMAIRRELCNEGIRLATLLAENPIGQTPENFALLALMHLHSARLASRQDASGGLLLLEEQNRKLWNQDEIRLGLAWLARSADGENFSRYHAEAGIAAEHCLAASFASTRWDRVAENYELLERIAPSAIHQLNRAVAVAEWKGPAAALKILERSQPPTWLAGSYLWSAALADLHRRCGNRDEANRHADFALNSAPSEPVRQLLRRRLQLED